MFAGIKNDSIGFRTTPQFKELVEKLSSENNSKDITDYIISLILKDYESKHSDN
jgi:Zn-dependent M32 family carboxypeptidase